MALSRFVPVVAASAVASQSWNCIRISCQRRPLWKELAGSITCTDMASDKPISSYFQAPKRLKVTNTTLKEVDPSKVSSASAKVENEEKVAVTEAQESPRETEAVPQAEESVTKDGPGSQETDVSQEQKIRMELNKSIARATRNLKVCDERVVIAHAAGKAFPEFSQLLIDESWLEVVGGELEKKYMENLYRFVLEEAGGKIPIFPPPAKVFNAFNTCPFNTVKVVILGQDPYHGFGQAMGLSFSVPEGIKVPPSLANMYKEINSDVGASIPSHGNLEKWAYQGVLLLNTVLTVREKHPNSHAKKGWEAFTDAAIRAISLKRTGVVFLLWGKPAQEKIRLINASVHHILKAAHPSGLSAHRGFFGCKHFSETNKLLEKAGQLPIDWQL